MRILLNTGPAHPLFFPLVPLAWALRAAGHDVLVATAESFDDTVRRSGLPLAPVCGPLDMGDVMAKDRAGNPVRPPDSYDGMAIEIGRGFGRLAARTVEGTCELVERWRPDAIVTESYSFAAPAAAAAVHGVPWIRHTVGPGDLPVGPSATEELAPELAALGLDRLPDPALDIDNCPPMLGAPAAGAQQVRYVPFGEPGTVPSWVFAERSRPRVLVTLGSVQPQIGGIPMLAQMLGALSALDADLIVAVADHLVEKLRPLPANVVNAGWVSLTSSLPGCDAVVHHGGPGTMLAALCHGLPQVVVPGRGKPLDAIRRLAELGAVYHLPPQELGPERLLESCRTLLEDPAYGKQAVAVREEIERQPAPAALVPVIERVAAAAT